MAAGLDSSEVARRAAEAGPNRLPRPHRPSPAALFARQLIHKLALLLWVAAGLALIARMIPLAVAIVAVVLINGSFAFAQEYRADRSAQRLDELLPAKARVRRDGRAGYIDAEELVPGDVVLLGPGDRIPADLSVLVSHGLSLDESLVTGESTGVPRGPGEAAVAGSFVIEGEAEAVVEAVGDATTVAEVAALTRGAHRPPSPLTVRLDGIVRTLAVVAVVTGGSLAAAGLLLGLGTTEALLFGIGVTVALVPEGLLPTVTLSLARGAWLMAQRNALVRRLDAVETLGATTYICTDKTGTLTQNRMAVVEVWTPAGTVVRQPHGYEPVQPGEGSPAALDTASAAAEAAATCVHGRVLHDGKEWRRDGDPMEAALHCWALSVGYAPGTQPVQLRRPYTAERMMSSVTVGGVSRVLGAPERVLDHLGSTSAATSAHAALLELADRGLRVLAVARGSWSPGSDPESAEDDLELLALVGLEDPPRPDVAEVLQRCRTADIRVAMVTGDHVGTATAIAREVGLLPADGLVLDGRQLPVEDADLGALLDRDDGVVVARVSPANKLRIARALQGRGHVVAMTGDGVNDAPALREADVGIAMGASGSDVAREVADLVLLDDHFATIVAAVELGRATFSNVRRFLTFHLADNVAELAPFAVWALTAGQVPLALGVLQILALDIGTDMLPAAALGAEPPSRRVMDRAAHPGSLVDRGLLTRAFGVLGPTEALVSMTAFLVVLTAGGWSWGATPASSLLASASGAAFAAIALGQMANAFACRSTSLPVWRQRVTGNRLVLYAVGAEVLLLVAFLALPPLTRLLGGTWPTASGWALAALAVPAVLLADAAHKLLSRRFRTRARGSWRAPGRSPEGPSPRRAAAAARG